MNLEDNGSDQQPKRNRSSKLLEGPNLFIREYTNKSGSVSYRIEGSLPVDTVEHPAGRVRENFNNLEEARDRMNLLEDLVKNIKVVDTITRVATRLTADQVKTAESAIHELGDLPAENLVTAVRSWKKHRVGTDPTMTLRQALASCIVSKRGAGRVVGTIRGYPIAVESFLRRHGTGTGQVDEFGCEISDIRIAYITRQQIKEWVEAFPVRYTGISHMRRLSAVLGWCVNNGKLATNPAIGVPLEEVSKVPRVIHILENWRCQAMLNKAAVYKNGIVLPYLVVCLFGAVRLEEAPRIQLEDVNLEKKFIRLVHTKTRLQRIVQLSENAAEMLRVYWKDRRGTFKPQNLRRCLAVIKAAAGYRDAACPKQERPEGWENFPTMPKNVLRHTGLSHKMAATDDVLETTRWGGNSPDTFYEFYYGLVDDATSAQFWSMRAEPIFHDPELIERIHKQLVEWDLLKQEEPVPSAPPVPVLHYQHLWRRDELLSLAPEQISALVSELGIPRLAAECNCSVEV